MTLSEIRDLVIQRYGRYDLVNSDGSDNGIDHYIRQAVKFLDLTVDHNDYAWYVTKAFNGDIIVPITRKLRTVLKAYATNGGDRYEMTIKRRQLDLVEKYSGLLGDIDRGQPKYLALINGFLSPRLVDLFNDHLEHGGLGDNESELDASDWTNSSYLTYESGSDGDDSVGILTNDGYATDPYIKLPYMSHDTNPDVDMIVTFLAKGINTDNAMTLSATGHTRDEVHNPALKPYYQRYTWKLTANTAYNFSSGSITLYPFGDDTSNFPPTGAQVYIKDVQIRPMNVNISFALHTGPEINHIIGKRSIMIYPPSEGTTKIELFGRMYSDDLDDDSDENYWTVHHPELLVLAVGYQLEAALRNTQGMTDFMNAMQPFIRGIQADTYEEEMDDLNEMEG